MIMVADYQDENRYSAGRGAHINLKRAERARILVNKIPGKFFVVLMLSYLVQTSNISGAKTLMFRYG